MDLKQFVREAFAGLPTTVRVNGFLAGGALRAFYDKTEVKDYDLFFSSDEAYNLSVEVMSGRRDFSRQPDAGRSAVFLHRESGRLYNLIGFCFNDPQQTIERFDFRCCRIAAWIDAQSEWVYMTADPDAVADATAKLLVVVGNNGSERTMRRIEHYIDDYGYTLAGDDLGAADEEVENALPPHTRRYRAIRHVLSRIPPTPSGGY